MLELTIAEATGQELLGAACAQHARSRQPPPASNRFMNVAVHRGERSATGKALT
ncbi:hypothetical protein [Burkholderia cenocepacia]|uniref:hypothetical protein n=1 Tax=Burkholderia cenocepacia TaxID=95486 RepID=UPI00163B2C32|nr:hypothetical protein [Burkholderia cenocepacia]